MNDMSTNMLGHNQPPVSSTAQTFSEEFSDTIAKAKECLESAVRLPSRIEDGDDETLNKASELVKKMREIELVFERAEKNKRAPLRAVLDAVSGFFKSQYEPLEKARLRLKSVEDDYMTRKRNLEEKRLREEEEKRREMQRQSEQRAKDAEDTKNVAAQQLLESERLAKEANEARAGALTAMDNAVADVAEAKAALAKARADAAEVAADMSRRIRDGETIAEEDRATKRADHQAKIATAKSRIDEVEQVLRDAREAARKAKEEQAKAEAEKAAAAREVRTAEREVSANLKEAVRHETVADRIEAKIDGPGGELVRTRSLHGAVTTLKRRWKSELMNRDAITPEDILKLFPFIHEDAISKAGWNYMQAQIPENKRLSGFRMWEDEDSSVR